MLDPAFLSKVAETAKGKMLGWTLIVAIILAMINILPQVYAEYMKSKTYKVVSLDDTYRDVLQKLYWYNKPVVNGLAAEYGESTVINSKSVTLTTHNLLSTHLQTAFDEMNRMNYCMPNVGTWVGSQLMSDSFKTEIVAYMTTETLTLDERLSLVGKVMLEYERKVGDNLRNHMRSVKTCAK